MDDSVKISFTVVRVNLATGTVDVIAKINKEKGEVGLSDTVSIGKPFEITKQDLEENS